MRDKNKEKREKRILRHKRVRALVKGTAQKPRLNVFRSNQHIWVQIIDDDKAHTLVSASDKEIKAKNVEVNGKKLGTKEAKAYLVGELVAKKAKEAGIKKVVFDRGGWKFHGRIKALAQGARDGGLEF